MWRSIRESQQKEGSLPVIPFPAPRLDAADRILTRFDMSYVAEDEFVTLMQESGFTHAQKHTPLTVRENLAFLVSVRGEADTLGRLLELAGEDAMHADVSHAEIEFQVRLAGSIQKQASSLGVPDVELMDENVRALAFGEVTNLCGNADVEVVPWVTSSGTVLLQWSRMGDDYVAGLAADVRNPERVMLHLETAERQELLPYSVGALSAFLRSGTWPTTSPL